MLASLDRQNSVSYSVRKFIRPLIHRLVSDAYCLGGSGDGTAQQFNGFCFEHALLNQARKHLPPELIGTDGNPTSTEQAA